MRLATSDFYLKNKGCTYGSKTDDGIEPCRECSYRAKCRDELKACDSYRAFLSREPEDRKFWLKDQTPSRAHYMEIFE